MQCFTACYFPVLQTKSHIERGNKEEVIEYFRPVGGFEKYCTTGRVVVGKLPVRVVVENISKLISILNKLIIK